MGDPLESLARGSSAAYHRHSMCATLERLIEPGASRRNYWRRLLQNRHLIAHMAWSDILVRYKQTYLGLGWAIVQPLMSIIIFTLVFDRLARLPSVGDAPYPLVVFAGLLPWNFFAQAMTLIPNSARDRARAHHRGAVPTPRAAAEVARGRRPQRVDLVRHLAVRPARLRLPARLALLRVPVLHAVRRSHGARGRAVDRRPERALSRLRLPRAVSAAARHVHLARRLRDDHRARQVALPLLANPLVDVIDGARWSLFRGGAPVHLEATLLSFSIVLALVWGGLWFFRRAEGTLADHI